jgi:monofunctional biosynthetic peptidoglycan transglycosylase
VRAVRARSADRLRRIALLMVAAAALGGFALAFLWGATPDPSPLLRENPRTTALIEQRRSEARARRRPFHARQVWVPLDRMAGSAVDAVLLSEDANFFGHAGIDWQAMREAAEADWKARGFARGASTLTQQLAKNLWLGTEKSLLRKAKEAVLAAKLERSVPKRRILALYLNVAEWGEGVFGIEAGAQTRFGTTAARLSTAQSVVMASMLPAPRRIDLARPSTWLRQRTRRLLDRLRDAGRISVEEHLHASAELERILAGPAPVHDLEEPPEDEVEAESTPTPTPNSTANSTRDPVDASPADAQNGAARTEGQSESAPTMQGGAPQAPL